ncbi:TPA: hypothetical protein ACN1DA_004909 [Escherichia coli]
MNTDLLAISKEIHDDAIAQSDSWHHYKMKDGGRVKVMNDVLPKIKII